jgi:predicted nuclease of restriction endonuclease-like (RecB) superfamily
MTLKRNNNFEGLIKNISKLHDALQGCVAKSVNQLLTVRNWIFGYYIVEYEQNGADRAKYGEKLIANIESKVKHIKGMTGNQLYVCVNFYQTYPHFLRTLSVKLQEFNLGQDEILRSLTVKFQQTNNEDNIILQTLSGKLETPIWKTLPPDLLDGNKLHPKLLLSRLTYTHFVELIRVADPLQRLFYEVETIKNNWSVRELKRAITTQLAFRTTMSTNKDAVIAKIKNLKPVANAEIIRNPYILEFLGLEEKPEYNESDLEQQILNHLQQFLIELGTGFCFEARQKRITFNNKYYRIDLVFYHRILKCHVLIDLKIHEFDYADAGQMNLYLNYYKDNEIGEGDNPPVGIILCADKDDLLVEYSTAGMDDRLFVSKYLVNLPEKNVLEAFIRHEMGAVTE